jgi:hypothetical protein
MQEVDGLLVLLRAGGWVPFAAGVVGLLVRLTRDDTKVPINVPAVWRPYLALLLGTLLGVLEKQIAGSSWRDALLGGAAAAFAVVAHLLGIELMNDGKELPVPFLMKKGGNDEGK